MRTAQTLYAVLGALASTSILVSASSPLRGVDPAFASHYSPGHTFTCIDGSRSIPFSAVNDDYCDCPDGSDEPGTSACEGRERAWFWCENKGHVPGRVRAGRVNDGICDPECCDGSEEWATGACADRCAEIGREYRERIETEAKVRKTGAKIRSTYVKHAVKERERLQAELASKQAELKAKEKDVEAARVHLESSEAASKEDLEKKRATPLFQSLVKHRETLTRLRAQRDQIQSKLDTVLGILDELSKGYNPNYQDMAVKAAVVGYQELVAPPSEGEGENVNTEVGVEVTDKELDDLGKQDLDSLLLLDTDTPAPLLFKIDEYIPDSLYDYYDALRDYAIDLLLRIGWIGTGQVNAVEGAHVAAARERFNELTKDVNRLGADIKSTQGTLDRMREDYGPEGEWKKLDGQCVDTVAGDYTYEICWFGKATQKSNKDHSSNNLGSFMGWNVSAEHGTYNYYTRQQYKNGAKCWNGPLRSVMLDLSCGTTNAILSVSEPEKCEYRFKATTPALCWPIDSKEGVRDEL